MSEVQGTAKLDLNAEKFIAESKKAANAIENVGNKGEQTGQKIDKSTQKVTKSMIRGTASVVGFSSSLIATGFAAGGLVDKENALASANLKVQKSLLQVKKLTDDNKEGTDEYAIAIEQLRLNQEKATKAAGDITKAQVNLGLSLVTMATSTIPNMIVSLKGMSLGHTVASKAAIVQTGSNIALTTSIRASTVAMLTNPIFLPAALAAIAVGVGVLASGILDVKDSVDATTHSMQVGTPVIESYGHAMDPTLVNKANNAAQAIRGVADAQLILTDANKEFIKTLQGQFQSKNVGFSGAIEFYRKQDEFLSEVKRDFDLLLSKGFNIKNIVAAITEAHGEQAAAVGITNRDLDRQLRVYLAIERSAERLKKLEKERAKEKKNEAKELSQLTSGNFIDNALSNINRQIGEELIDAEANDREPNRALLGSLFALADRIRTSTNIGRTTISRGKKPSAVGGNAQAAFNTLRGLNGGFLNSLGNFVGNPRASELSQNQLATLQGLGAGTISAVRASVGRPNSRGAAGERRAGGHSKFRQDRFSGRLNSFIAFTAQPLVARLGELALRLGVPIPSLTFASGIRGNPSRTAALEAQNLQRILAFNKFKQSFVNFQSNIGNKINELTTRSNLSSAETNALVKTPQGFFDLNNIIGFEERKLLEANTV